MAGLFFWDHGGPPAPCIPPKANNFFREMWTQNFFWSSKSKAFWSKTILGQKVFLENFDPKRSLGLQNSIFLATNDFKAKNFLFRKFGPQKMFGSFKLKVFWSKMISRPKNFSENLDPKNFSGHPNQKFFGRKWFLV